MTDFERFASALAMTESHDSEFMWGDPASADGKIYITDHNSDRKIEGSEFLACGRWQMHPAFVDEWWPDEVGVDWSWDHLFKMALLRFYSTRVPLTSSLIHLVMEFHLGAEGVKKGKWDGPYAERFTGFYSSIK